MVSWSVWYPRSENPDQGHPREVLYLDSYYTTHRDRIAMNMAAGFLG